MRYPKQGPGNRRRNDPAGVPKTGFDHASVPSNTEADVRKPQLCAVADGACTQGANLMVLCTMALCFDLQRDVERQLYPKPPHVQGYCRKALLSCAPGVKYPGEPHPAVSSDAFASDPKNRRRCANPASHFIVYRSRGQNWFPEPGTKNNGFRLLFFRIAGQIVG